MIAIILILTVSLLGAPTAVAAMGSIEQVGIIDHAKPADNRLIAQGDDNGDYSSQAPEPAPPPPDTSGASDYSGSMTEYSLRLKRKCVAGYVWREAFRGDAVCVRPGIREQARRDNLAGPSRRQPGGGAYGPDTCRQGFVWREASPSDHVCVTPQVRAETANDNGEALSRTAPFKIAPH
jgi:hypothetical protein